MAQSEVGTCLRFSQDYSSYIIVQVAFYADSSLYLHLYLGVSALLLLAKYNCKEEGGRRILDYDLVDAAISLGFLRCIGVNSSSCK